MTIGSSPWFHMHSQRAADCHYDLCRKHADDPSYPGQMMKPIGRPMIPEDPFNEMDNSATIAHEIYVAHVKVGFTKPQALWLTAALLNPRFGGPPDDDDGDDDTA